MAYFGYQGIHTRKPRYRHPDGSVTQERPATGIIAYHDDCAYVAFGVDRSSDGWGSWHHDKGMSWAPGSYSSGTHPCAHCGVAC